MTEHETALALYHLLPAEAWEWEGRCLGHPVPKWWQIWMEERMDADPVWQRRMLHDGWQYKGDYITSEAQDRLCTLAKQWLRKEYVVMVHNNMDGTWTVRTYKTHLQRVELIPVDFRAGQPTELEAVLAACKAVVEGGG